uniref:Uncharacterized protein n=1 Tax=Myotis myotis TaxID=51298 RepID=A0A7J7SRF5_MYOMY|nr:hypothetical protein mMyoMyo1_009347 [Myotis myotis]
MGTLDKGRIPVPHGIEGVCARFHHTTQNGVRFKTYELLILQFFHLTFSEWVCPWVTKTTLSETLVNKFGGLLYSPFVQLQHCPSYLSSPSYCPNDCSCLPRVQLEFCPCPPLPDKVNKNSSPQSSRSFSIWHQPSLLFP